ncbi:Uncharacterised protein [Providencia stuartii]|nr:Uncharacterised protein [Providencia stuartii]
MKRHLQRMQWAYQLDEAQQKMSGFGSFKRVMDCLETGLSNAAPYICGQQLTAIDVYVGAFLLFMEKINFIENSAVINHYLDTLKSHPKFAKSIAS